MKSPIFSPKPETTVDIEAAADLIVRTQQSNGEIPWFEGGKTDPWDHVEAAMGLAIAGRLAEARRAFEWMAARQLPDGSWYAAYRQGRPADRTRDTNLSAYIAVGVWHFYLISGDLAFARRMWPAVRAAIDYALALQAPSGEVCWAKSPAGEVDRMALLTGSSSIYMSLKCALALAGILGFSPHSWEVARQRLGEAIRHKPQAFNMTKARFAMDWFYPVLCGALRGDPARQRLERFWKKFVVEDRGVRCVSDEPWITLAETCELVLALWAVEQRELARIIFNWICDKKFDDGSYWCGFTVPDMIRWPEEKMTWTNAAVLLAADTLFSLTPAAGLFNHRCWQAGRFHRPG